MSSPDSPAPATVLVPGEAGHQRIPVNVYETTEALVLIAPMPGVRAENVTVTVSADAVVLSAELRTAAPKDYLLHEWEYGLYERRVDLPGAFGGSVSATLGHGQLAVSIARGAANEGRSPIVVRPSEPSSGPTIGRPTTAALSELEDSEASVARGTSLSEVTAGLDDEGRTGQFQAVEGGDIRCLTCQREFPAAGESADDITRLECASDPGDMSIVVAVTCPHCHAAGALIARYGPEAGIAEADVLVALDRQPKKHRLAHRDADLIDPPDAMPTMQ